MNLVELADRANYLVSKYEKYIPDSSGGKKKLTAKGAFEEYYVELIDQINSLNLKSEESGNEINRAVKAALNAELRKAKANLQDTCMPKLEKLSRRGKNLTKETVDERAQKVQQVKDGIAGIADGVSGSRKPKRPLTPLADRKRGRQEIKVSATGFDERQHSPGYFKQTESSAAFRQDWEAAKLRQDKALDNIEKGLGVLSGLGEAMGENLNQQDVLLTEIDSKMDSATKNLKTNNMKLKGLVTQMRSSKNFCVDVALVCVLLAMGLWIYNLFKK